MDVRQVWDGWEQPGHCSHEFLHGDIQTKCDQAAKSSPCGGSNCFLPPTRHACRWHEVAHQQRSTAICLRHDLAMAAIDAGRLAGAPAGSSCSCSRGVQLCTRIPGRQQSFTAVISRLQRLHAQRKVSHRTMAALVAEPETPLPTSTPAQRPDANGRYGRFGGKYVPETLIAALSELEVAYAEAQKAPEFQVRPAHQSLLEMQYPKHALTHQIEEDLALRGHRARWQL